MGDQRVCFTAHNFGHQGIAGESILWATGPARSRALLRPRAAAGQLQSRRPEPAQGRDRVLELRHDRLAQPRLGGLHTPIRDAGLGHTLHVHRDKFGGVLNGVDYDVWNPEIDPLIPQRLRAGLDRGQVRQQARAARALHAAARVQADRRLRRPAGQPEGRAPDPSRDLLCAGAGRAVRAAGIEPGPGDQRPLLASEASPERPPGLSTWSCSSTPSSRIWCTRGRTCW